ncbi:MAG TPA: hypothetical protein VKS22_05445 [Candidatus Binataceae bacterium]|nr:hypothetical protein [Candidatus Binataceae bacterium]
MQTHSEPQTPRAQERTKEPGGIVYRTACQNPGCTHTFDLRITPENAGLLSGTVACPRCRRHGGMLKPQGRLGDRLFSAKLVYRMTGIGPRPDEDDAYTETTEIRY